MTYRDVEPSVLRSRPCHTVRVHLASMLKFHCVFRSKKSIGIKKKCIPRMSKIKCQKRRNEGLFVDLCFIRLGDYSNYLGDLRYGNSPLNSYWQILENSSKYFLKFQFSETDIGKLIHIHVIFWFGHWMTYPELVWARLSGSRPENSPVSVESGTLILG